ncbi:MAG TPA: HisA/HisF-related TIM barrel protein [Acidisarcina sp.]|nr:HisA/HisF-related TIM barrel protein [Acidisarcina sp.]
MLIPSIDLMGGRIVQLVHGEKLKLAFDDFGYWIERFRAYPLVQLIDLDAAMRKGENRALIERIAHELPCQVGGGISSIDKARNVLAAGAKRVIVGSALFRSAGSAEDAPLVNVDFAESLANAVGGEHVVAGVDTKQGRVAVKGWTESVELTAADAISALEPYCGAFLYTHIDKEGTMQGFPYDIAVELRAKTKRQLIAAGGIREQSEIDALDAIGVDAVAGMAIYTGVLKT